MKVKAIAAPPVDPVLLRLGERLRAAGYDPAALRERLGVSVPDDIGQLNHAPAWQRLRADRSPAHG